MKQKLRKRDVLFLKPILKWPMIQLDETFLSICFTGWVFVGSGLSGCGFAYKPLPYPSL